jgi:anti-anti-sigma factor
MQTVSALFCTFDPYWFAFELKNIWIMEIIIDEKIRCIKPLGRLDANSSNDLDQALMTLPENGQDVIIDLSGCHYLSSAGIRILLKAKKKLQSGHNELFLTGVVPEVFHVLEIAGLRRVLRFENNVETALAIIQSSRSNKAEITMISIDHHQLVYQPTGEVNITGELCVAAEIVSYYELGFALGFGSFSDIEASHPDCTDFFVTLENRSGFLPLNQSAEPDFRITSDPVKTGLSVCEALSFGHSPAGSLRLTKPGILTFSQFNGAIRYLKERTFSKNSVTLMVLANLDKNKPSLSLALSGDADLAGIVRENGMNRFQHLLSGNTEKPEFKSGYVSRKPSCLAFSG